MYTEKMFIKNFIFVSLFLVSYGGETNSQKDISTLLTSFSKLISKQETLTASDVEDLATVSMLEFLASATGNHFIQPDFDEATEKLRRKQAAAVCAIWLDLFWMEEVDEIMTNASVEAAKNLIGSKLQSADDFGKVMTSLFDKILKGIEAKNFLKAMLNTEQLRYENAVNFHNYSGAHRVYFPYANLQQPNGAAIDEAALSDWRANIGIRKFAINKLFLLTLLKPAVSTTDSLESFVLTRSILNVAEKSVYQEPMQLVYSEELNYAAKNWKDTEFPQGTIQSFQQALRKRTESDAKLQAEFKTESTKVKEALAKGSASKNLF